MDCKKDVSRFEVSMNHIFTMNVLQAVEYSAQYTSRTPDVEAVFGCEVV